MTTTEQLPDFDWSGVQDAIAWLDDHGVVPLADAVRSLDTHDTAASSRLSTLTDDVARAVKLLDSWLGYHACEPGAENVAAARELLNGGSK